MTARSATNNLRSVPPSSRSNTKDDLVDEHCAVRSNVSLQRVSPRQTRRSIARAHGDGPVR